MTKTQLIFKKKLPISFNSCKNLNSFKILKMRGNITNLLLFYFFISVNSWELHGNFQVEKINKAKRPMI